MQNRNQNINQHSLPLPLEKTDAFKAGDGKAVRDTQSNLIWLNFGVNSAQSFNDVFNALTTTYQGWRLPTEQEVKDLWSRLFASNVSSNDPYQVFRVWGANKSPINRAPYTSFGYFLDSEGFLASASIIEQGSEQNPNRDPFYLDGVVKSNITTSKEFNHNQPDSPPFNMGGTQEISTLLVKG